MLWIGDLSSSGRPAPLSFCLRPSAGRSNLQVPRLCCLRRRTASGQPAAAQPAGPKEKNGPELPKQKEDPFKADIERLGSIPIAPSESAAPISLQQQVSSVSRQESTVAHSPAAIFVITQEMIRRSSATTLPELFRMVPGLDVARVDSSRWAISSRGFNNRLTDKLLVQIDGSTVYNPIFSGVFWEIQDLLLQDIERIEVIRGPGATLWGQNAVNGIINVITKRTQDTQGSLLVGGGGTQAQGMTGFRHGGKLGDDLTYRVWGKWNQAGAFFAPAGNAPFDDWRQGRAGFRFDWLATCQDTVTFQGDFLRGDYGRSDINKFALAPPFVTNLTGDDRTFAGNLLGRWRHEVGERSDWTLLAYYDHFDRQITSGLAAFRYDIFDVDFVQQFPLTARQQLIYGLGYRNVGINFQGSTFDNNFNLSSAERNVNYYSAFVQDEFTLVKDRLFFTAGCKFLENGFSGFEYQPSGRFLWTPDERHSVWTAVSRAVRTPSLLDQNLSVAAGPPSFPPGLGGALLFPKTVGNRGVISEDLVAYEMDFRAQASESFSWDLALFYNVYDNLVTFRPGAKPVAGPVAGTFVFPLNAENGLNAEGYGGELAATWKLSETWRLYGNYSFLQLNVHRAEGLPASAEIAERRSPRHQIYLQSSWDICRNVEFDLYGRYVDAVPGFFVPTYFSLDVRLAWRPRPNLELSVLGQSLLQSNHTEIGTAPPATFPLIQVPRGVYAMLTYRW